MNMDMSSHTFDGVAKMVDDSTEYIQRYDDAFPKLRSTQPNHQDSIERYRDSNKFMLRPTTCSQVFTVPSEERRFLEMNEQNFGGAGEQEKVKEIMQKTSVKIEMSEDKDKSLTIVISGKVDAVMKAKRLVMSQLHKQASVTLKIPREHHRNILGLKGKKLRDLELETGTKISMPRPEDSSDIIRISGTQEGINKARHEIQCISDEQAKLATERLVVDHRYHPFICGPYQETMKQLMDETGVRINVPPSSSMKDEIVVSGEKEGVMYCKAYIMEVYKEKKSKCHELPVEVKKSQHKYLIGPKRCNINEILRETQVSVEIPSMDSNSETVILRGEQKNLGNALSLVFSKANSVIHKTVDCDSWIHRYIIGRGGSNLQSFTQEFPNIHIEFIEEENSISLEGPPDEMSVGEERMKSIVADLKNRYTYREVTIPHKNHKHIIGKNGNNIMRIKKDNNVTIDIPPDNDSRDTIRIEGPIEGVALASEQLMMISQRLENEKTREISIEQRFHSQLIGQKGDRIREFRDMFADVQITFPEVGRKSDIVTLRGPKNEVDKCYKHLAQLNQELIVNNYQSEVKIFKQYHKNVIGKGGSNIKRIREETETTIDLPYENSESDIIVITGRKDNVEAAKAKIEAIQKELANITEITVEIPQKFHNSIIGTKGRLIRSIMDDFGGVQIRFPSGTINCDQVTIRGPKEDAYKAKKYLLELTNEKELSSYTAEVRAKPEYHKFLIGRGGMNIKKVRESTGTRIIFPTESDTDNNVITIIGKQNAVDEAKAHLEALIKDLESIVEIVMTIHLRHHRHFIIRRGEVLHSISEEFGGVTISFPRSDSNSDRVVIKGAKDCVEGAKIRLQEIVDELEAQVTITCVIPQRFHRSVLGPKGANVQEITRANDVQIKFPDRNTSNNNDGNYYGTMNGDMNIANGFNDLENANDLVRISGKIDNCEAAKRELLDLVPITVDVEVPYDIHRIVIGQQGKEVRRIMDEFDVNVVVPHANEKSDFITVTGPPQNVEKTKAALAELILRNHKETIDIDPFYHARFLGRRRAVISKLESDCNVSVSFPNRADPNRSTVTVTGLEEHVKSAISQLKEMVLEMENMVNLDANIDHRYHSMIIGAKGHRINKLMTKYNVELSFPQPGDENQDLVVINGLEDNVYDCYDELMNMIDEQDDITRDQEFSQARPQSFTQPNDDTSATNVSSKGFVVRDAPWDMKSNEDFPSIGTTSQRSVSSWGPPRKN